MAIFEVRKVIICLINSLRRDNLNNMDRRYFLGACASFATVAALGRSNMVRVFGQGKSKNSETNTPIKKIMKSDEEWKRLLTPDQYAVTRQAATERPYTSPLLDVHDEGA